MIYLYMMRVWVLMIFFLFGRLVVSADPYLLYKEQGKIGIKDEAGHIVIPAAFDALGWSDGSFSVASGVTGYKLNQQWGLINLKKEFIGKAEYENITWPGGDRIIAEKKISPVALKTGCLNLKGEVVVPFIYDGLQINGLRAIAILHTGTSFKYGLIDINGHEIVPLKYAMILRVGSRYLISNVNKKTGLFTEEGKKVIDFLLDSVSAFHHQYAFLYKDFDKGLINREGDIVVPPDYANIRVDENDKIFTRRADEWKVLSGDNKEKNKIVADQLIPFSATIFHITRGNLHGLVTRDFKTVLPITYSFLGALTDNKLIAAQNGKFGVIRVNGSVVLPLQYDSVLLERRIIRVETIIGGKPRWAIYDTLGVRRTAGDFDFIAPYNSTIFPAKKGNFWGGIDLYGRLAVQCVFDSLTAFAGDVIAVKFKGQFGIIDTRERWILPPQSEPLQLINNSRYWQQIGKTIFVRDFAGRDIYFTDNQLVFGETDMTETSADGSEKRIDYDGRIVARGAPVLVTEAQKVFPESEGLRGIRKDGKYGFVDDRGRLRIANRYEGIGMFKEGVAPVKIAGKWGYINHAEAIVIQPVYDEPASFFEQRAIVGRNKKFGLIDPQGKLILLMRYDSIGRLPKGGFQLKWGRYYGIADHQGQIPIDTRYEKVERLDNGYTLVARDGKSGLLTDQGLSTIPMQYDVLLFDKDRDQYLGVTRSIWLSYSR